MHSPKSENPETAFVIYLVVCFDETTWSRSVFALTIFRPYSFRLQGPPCGFSYIHNIFMSVP